MNQSPRQRVIETATEAFHREGIRGVTMDNIAHRLSMSKRTLYELFADKEALLLACCKWHDDRERARYDALVTETSSVLDFVLAVFAKKMSEMDNVKPSFLSDLNKYPRVVAYIRRRQRSEEDKAVAFLEQGIAQGYFRAGVNFRIVVRYISQGIENIINCGLLDAYSQREVFTNTAMLIVRGCATVRGIRLIDEFLELHKDDWRAPLPG